ncbi:contractile injection system protein, VgrG/Pvc8 family [Paenibacillus thiaminolyticus]|uniref:Late control protein n=1 Tax=Paenibacillus thiaminolyticus TaxID=49283 RepID=A0A3A3GYV7_PANTH|nr:contractile injection system protein, VgrG/Pvc8 family [Paenibacillus thiaminolyticus]RJG21435.1 late control protein [Paenibacillus thiaminolyticus]
MQSVKGVTTYQDLQLVWPFGAMRLDRLELIHQTGEHAILRFTGIASEERIDEIIGSPMSQERIELHSVADQSKGRPLFMGRLTHVEVKVVRSIHYIEAEAVSHTYAMDIAVNTRSFQQPDRLYRDIAQEIVGAYSGGELIDNAFSERQQGKFIMQYEETDWAFLKRLASHAGALLVPDVTAHKARLWIGLPEGRRQIQLDAHHPYEVNHAVVPYTAKSVDGTASVREYRYTTYEFENDECLEIGDKVMLAGQTFVITRRTGVMQQGVFRWRYVCAAPDKVKRKKSFNSTIIGAAIDGTIIQVSRNQVKLHLDMDKQQDASKAQWFPYAAEGNQILYLMPELGTRVKLYFPSADEDEAMVIQSVRVEPQGDYVEKHERKMADPGVKSFGNPQGKEFTLGDKELYITAQEGKLYISMNSYSGVNLSSAINIQIQAAGDLSFHGQQIQLQGMDGLYISTPSVTMELAEEVSVRSDEIQLEAENRRQHGPLMSEFEEDLEKYGETDLSSMRRAKNFFGRAVGVGGAVKDWAMDVLKFANDAGEVALTNAFSFGIQHSLKSSGTEIEGVETKAVADALSDAMIRTVSEGINGQEVAPLAERNSIVQGIAKGKTYAADIWSREKSFSDLLSDGAEMVDKSVIQPISKASELEVFKLDLLTTSYEQNVEAGRVAAEGGLVLVDTALTLGTASEYAIAKSEKLVKMFSGAAEDVATGARKLPDGGASGKKPLHPSIPHHTKKKGPPKDGKFKTHAKSLGERFEELEAAIGKLLGKMPKDMADRMPFKVAYMQKAGTNQRVPTIVKNSDHPMYSKMDGGNGEGSSGRRAEGTRQGNKPNLYDKDGNYTGDRTQKELDDLATDPDRGHVLDDQGKKEREVGLAVEERGELGRIKRDSGGAEFYDESSPNKQRWDVKSYESYPNGHTDPKKGAFSVKTTLKNMYKKLNKDINIIIDTRGLIPEHIAQLKDAVTKEGIGDRIIWYP